VRQTTAAKPTVKLRLTAIRRLFDWLIIGQVLTGPIRRTRCVGLLGF
jgi:hypothetical protein